MIIGTMIMASAKTAIRLSMVVVVIVFALVCVVCCMSPIIYNIGTFVNPS